MAKKSWRIAREERELAEKREKERSEGMAMLASLLKWERFGSSDVFCTPFEDASYCSGEPSSICSPREMKFDSSWDWLMPAIHAIKWLEDVDDEKYEEIDNGLTNCLIGQTYEAAIDFLKWYNSGEE